MDEDRLDLSALDPTAPTEELDRAVSAILRRAEPTLARRRGSRTVLGTLSAWRRPMAAGLGLAAGIALLLLVRAKEPAVEVGGSATLAEAIGLSSSVASWVERGDTPAIFDLFSTGDVR
jgi:ferric-dicitrate binding protein FerR (iron transport regulator)